MGLDSTEEMTFESVGFGKKGKTLQPEGILMTGNGKSGEGDMSDSHDIIAGPGVWVRIFCRAPLIMAKTVLFILNAVGMTVSREVT